MSVFKDLENCHISISQTDSLVSSDRDVTNDKKFQSEEEIDKSKRNPNLIFSKERTTSGKKPMYSSFANCKKPLGQKSAINKPELNLKNIFINRQEYDSLKLKQYIDLSNIDIVRFI
jgi:hypothetical protein